MINLLGFTGFGKIDPGYLTGAYDPSGVNLTGVALAIFIKNDLNAVYVVVGLTTFIYLILGGFKYITAAGDTKVVQEASKKITGAIMGLVIIIASYAFVSVIGSVLGVPIFTPVFRAP